MDHAALEAAERAAGLHDRENTSLRVKWVNTMRSFIAHRCPVNVVGTPLVSDIDVLLMSTEERAEALRRTLAPKK